MMVETNLTRRQAQVLDAIERSPHPPTFRELGEATHIGTATGVREHLDALERKGRIKKMAARTRAISVVKPLTDGERQYYELPPLARCDRCGRVLPKESA